MQSPLRTTENNPTTRAHHSLRMSTYPTNDCCPHSMSDQMSTIRSHCLDLDLSTLWGDRFRTSKYSHSQPVTITVDLPQATITSKAKCVTIMKTDGSNCTVTLTPPCPVWTFSYLSTVKVTNYCGCDCIKETTIYKMTCKIFLFL
jgi:hypothetical protein